MTLHLPSSSGLFDKLNSPQIIRSVYHDSLPIDIVPIRKSYILLLRSIRAQLLINPPVPHSDVILKDVKILKTKSALIKVKITISYIKKR